MNRNEVTFKEFEDFIREESGEYKIEISNTTSIEDGLGITGEEAIELIEKFSEKYNVDIKSFELDKYFYPEPGIFSSFDRKVAPLTIGDLFKAIALGKLE